MLVLDLAYRAPAVRMRDEAYGRLDHIEILVNNLQSGWRPRLRLAESLQLTALWWCRIGSLGLAILDGFFGLQRIRVLQVQRIDRVLRHAKAEVVLIARVLEIVGDMSEREREGPASDRQKDKSALVDLG